MKKYKKGLQTEQIILQTAKILFYNNGYAKTSMRDICAETGIQLGTLTYYFKKKKDIAERIYSEFIVRLMSFVRTKTYHDKMNGIQLNFHKQIYHYHAIYSDPQTRAFHAEMLHSEYIYQEIILKLYNPYFRDLPNRMTKTDFDTAVFADSCLRKEFGLQYINAPQTKTVTELYITIQTLTGRLMRIPEETTQQYIQEALTFFENHDGSTIRLLI
ncbi:TetR/AcrR family transcriptional regulator [Acetobacterium sp.]|uniref:TetR/AcrR family transcriptional regulator n=1 Tax=Acetobacterium sp. TaxID=1872094 RepID=UPI0035937B6B